MSCVGYLNVVKLNIYDAIDIAVGCILILWIGSIFASVYLVEAIYGWISWTNNAVPDQWVKEISNHVNSRA